MTTPAQLERLGEHLLKLRLQKCGERLEAMLQQAAAEELPYADFLERLLGEEVGAKTSKNIAMRTAMVRQIRCCDDSKVLAIRCICVHE